MTKPITKQLPSSREELEDLAVQYFKKTDHLEAQYFTISDFFNGIELDLLKTIESEVEKRKAQCFKCKSTELSRGMDGKAICEKCLSDNQWNNITVSLNEELDQVIALLKEE